ncbi:hypothetical protein AAE478_004504 [Parahypoxylon ruwenzoriense]
MPIHRAPPARVSVMLRPREMGSALPLSARPSTMTSANWGLSCVFSLVEARDSTSYPEMRTHYLDAYLLHKIRKVV